jgi:hypothetical protein
MPPSRLLRAPCRARLSRRRLHLRRSHPVRAKIHQLIDRLDDDILRPALHAAIDTLSDDAVPQVLRRMLQHAPAQPKPTRPATRSHPRPARLHPPPR